MKITLYNSCILNNSYKEVFYHKRLETYLTTLNSTSFDVDDVYIKENGTYEIDLSNFSINSQSSLNFLNANYMKITISTTNSTTNTKYYFIKNIAFINDVAYIDYEIDIWSCYSSLINIRYGNIERHIEENNLRVYLRAKFGSSYVLPNRIKYLPIEFATNNTPIIKSLNSTNTKFYNIMLVQYYTLASQGELTARIPYCVIETDNNATSGLKEYANIQTYQKEITQLKVMSAQSQSTSSGYEIIETYCVPSYLINNNESTLLASYFTDNIAFSGKTFKMLSYELDMTTINSTIETLFNTDFNNNNIEKIVNQFKNLSVGFIGNMQQVEFNGTSTEFKIKLLATSSSFSVLMYVKNSITEITQNIKFDIPVSVQSASATQQQAIAREISERMMHLNQNYMTGKTALGITGDVLNGIASADKSKSTMGAVASLGNSFINVGSNILNINEKIETMTIQSYAFRDKQFETASASNVQNKLFTNLVYGLCLFVLNTENDEQVLSIVKNYGFIVDHYIDSSFDILDYQDIDNQYAVYTNTIDFDFIQFNNINIYGEFSEIIRQALETILTSGIKIRYTNNV